MIPIGLARPGFSLRPLPAFVLGALFLGGSVEAQTLQGSSASLDRQNLQARAHDFTYLQTPQQVRSFVEAGYLVPVVPNRDFSLHQVSFPYARPEVRLFIERLASQYRASCGEQLVVTSLTRPISNQPPNASSRSVHPTGMALDLRRSANPRCRQWLESTLLNLESQGLLEAIYERNPPHYHVAVYPQPYAQYVARMTGGTTVLAQSIESGPVVQANWVTHTVTRGESLSRIASRYGTAVSRIRSENGIRGDRILVGQRLRIPVYEVVSTPQVASAPQEPEATVVSTSGGATPTPAPEPAVTVAASVSSSPTLVHEVRRGESLWTIARRYGVTEDALRRANAVNGSRIIVGQRLTVPGASGEAVVADGIHTVRRGETLSTIAQAHGVSQAVLRAANGIQGSRIVAGQDLVIPGSESGGVLAYTVQNGDSLWVIANRLGISVDEIRTQNGMNGSQIYAGQVLNVQLGR